MTRVSLKIAKCPLEPPEESFCNLTAPHQFRTDHSEFLPTTELPPKTGPLLR